MIRLIWMIAVYVVLAGTQPAMAKRVALVIGNSNYQHAPELVNPRNDAKAVASTLSRLEFEVIEGVDLKRADFEQKIREFAKAIRGADVALFYYAGHGLQVDGRNYLAPIETRLQDEADLDFEAVRLQLVIAQMEREPSTNLIILDACRNNPLARNLARSMGTRSASVGRGLAPLESGVGTLIAFATQPGNVALDGEGRNSPFTAALVKYLEMTGEDFAVTLRRVRQDVIAVTNGAQVPWSNSSLTGPVVLKSGPGAANPEQGVALSNQDTEIELEFWSSIKNSGEAAYFNSYLAEYPNGRFAAIARLRLDELGKEGGERAAGTKNGTDPSLPSMGTAASGSAKDQFAFDGWWTVSVHSRSGCRSNDSVAFPINVVKGVINEPNHRLPKRGTISEDGQFRIEVLGENGRQRSVQSGKITGDTGTGRFIGNNAGCEGRVEINRVR